MYVYMCPCIIYVCVSMCIYTHICIFFDTEYSAMLLQHNKETKFSPALVRNQDPATNELFETEV